MILSKQLSFTVASFLTVASPLSAYDASNRHLLKPLESIAKAVENEHANGNARPHLTITANIAGGSDTVSYDVHEADPAVTDETTITTSSRGIIHVDPIDIATVMVSDDIDNMVLLAVDTTDGTTHGFSKSSQNYNYKKITQKSGEQVKIYDS